MRNGRPAYNSHGLVQSIHEASLKRQQGRRKRRPSHKMYLYLKLTGSLKQDYNLRRCPSRSRGHFRPSNQRDSRVSI